MIVNGWLDGAEIRPGPANKVNFGVNPVHGIVCHSAEGYAPGLISQLANAPVSWHLSVLKDGTIWQHYPFSAQCWHATAFNSFTIGIEHEGVAGQPFTAAQKAATRHIWEEVSQHYGWKLKRPTSRTDLTATLWEHNEVVRLRGGMGSVCPSSRVPWDELLNANEDVDMKQEGNFMVVYNGGVAVFRFGSSDGRFPGRLSKNFGGTWYWLRTSADGTAKWSSEEGD